MPRYVILIAKAGNTFSAHVPDVPGVGATGATVGAVTDTLPEPSVIASAVDVAAPMPLSAAHP
jgi:hypothetical protein